LKVLCKTLLQLNGTALPSLALENFQELEIEGLSGFDHEKAEESIAGALGTMYAGQYLLCRSDQTWLKLSFKAGADTVSG
jgi:hypothetical protein